MSGVFDKVLGFFRKPRQIPSYKYDTGLLWKVSNGRSKAYILGAIYFGKRGCFPMPVTIDEAFEDSQVLVVQSEAETGSWEARKEKMKQKCLLPEGVTIEDVVSPSTRKAIQEHGVDLKRYANYRPWILASTLEWDAMKSLGFSNKYCMSTYYEKRAKLLGMPVKSLGKSSQYAGASLQPAEESEFLYAMLQMLKEIERRNTIWLYYWRNGDTQGLEGMLLEYLDIFPKAAPYIQAAIWDLCGPMADKVEGYLKKGLTHFVIMSDGHAVGEQGVINLLKERGYQVRQLSVDDKIYR